MFHTRSFQTQGVIFRLTEPPQQPLYRLWSVCRFIQRHHQRAVSGEHPGCLIIVSGVKCGGKILGKVAQLRLYIPKRTHVRRATCIGAVQFATSWGEGTVATSPRSTGESTETHFSLDRTCVKRKVFNRRCLQKSTSKIGLTRLSIERSRTARQPQHTPGLCRQLRFWRLQLRILTLRNLPLHSIHQSYQFFRLLVSFGLLTHFLEILRCVSHTTGHCG